MQLIGFKTLAILLLLSAPALAQNNNLMAKVAYENAEAALESKNLAEGINELAKVDKLLGKLTPKSQYLRVQLWAQATEANPAYADSALQHVNNYLALAATFDVDEEKQLEAARLMQKLEKTKAAYEAKTKAELACKEKAKKLETDLLTRDQSKIAAITGFDWDKDPVKQLREADRIKGGVSKGKTSWPGYYIHKGEYYGFQVPGSMYVDISSKTKPYRIKGIDKDIDHQSYATTASGAFQRMSATVTVPTESIEGVISAFSDLLGFPPDVKYLFPESKTPMTQWYWWFKDYTVQLQGFPWSTSGYYYTIAVDRHYPAEAKASGYKLPAMECK